METKFDSIKRIMEFFFLPKSLALLAVTKLSQRANTTYNLHIIENREGHIILSIPPTEHYHPEKIGKYIPASVENAACITESAYAKLIQVLYKLPALPRTTITPYNTDTRPAYTLEILWNANPPVLPILKQMIVSLVLGTGIGGATYLLQPSLVSASIALGSACALAGTLGGMLIQKRKTLTKKIEQHYLALDAHMKDLETYASEILYERNMLQEKVTLRTKELSDAYERLKELDRAKTAFFTNITHELRTPLTNIVTPAEHARTHDSLRSKEARAHFLSSVIRNAERLLTLINGILDYTKIEAGKMDVTPKRVDVARITRHFASYIESAFQSKNIRYHVTTPAAPLYAVLDVRLFETAFFNLLSNAYKFTGQGGRVDVLLQSHKDTFTVSVTDTGIGIREDALPHIFERFVQADASTSRAYEGTGIGLTLTKEIVELHNGTITVRSRKGEGSTFTLSLPCNAFPAHETYDGDEEDYNRMWNGIVEAAPMPKEAKKRDACVLIVDDNKDMLDLLSVVLRDDYRVLSASNVDEAFTVLAAATVDIIVSDVMMPKVDGFGFLRMLRDDARYRAIPVIFLSARVDMPAKLEGLSSGGSDYVEKPFHPDELLARVALHLRLQRARVSVVNAFDEGSVERFCEARDISPRELDVLLLAIAGKANKEIAHELGITIETVKTHLSNTYRKVGVKNRVALLALFKNA